MVKESGVGCLPHVTISQMCHQVTSFQKVVNTWNLQTNQYIASSKTSVNDLVPSYIAYYTVESIGLSSVEDVVLSRQYTGCRSH